ncbi:hypothetical protein [Desulfitobacterium sp. AusDCA]|uniref:hypothetical protein n=1 Tax=Desulfitobacterium sp. AusDCA TaxID=3240383 RepID=UPI003DA7863B
MLTDPDVGRLNRHLDRWLNKTRKVCNIQGKRVSYPWAANLKIEINGIEYPRISEQKRERGVFGKFGV